MPLHTDYRPETLDEFIGNSAVIKSLESVLSTDDTPHTYLFKGPSGCGKTTLARIAANVLEIHERDLQEINAADYRGIDSVRELIKHTKLQGVLSNNKGYILDECHQLSKDAQSALLKVLEDTPSHVYFFLATTNASQLLPTLVNRCSTFEVELLDENELDTLLKTTLDELDLDGEEFQAVTDKIIEKSDGCPRRSLVLLDSVVAMDDQKEMLEAIKNSEYEEAAIIDLCRALIKRAPWKKVVPILKDIKKGNPESTRRAVLGYTTTVLLNKEDHNAYLVISCFSDNFYDSGFAGLVAACWEVINDSEAF